VQLYSGLITASKSAELNISLQPLKKGKQKPSLPRNLKDDPLIWRPDESTIEQWSRNTSTFWTSPAWTVTFNEGRLASIYERAIALQTRHGQDVLRFRFLFVFFHDLLCYLYPQHSKSAPASVYDRIVKIISTEGCNDLCVDEINSKVRDWVNRGRRYHKLTETFGDGILIELPVDVSRDA